MTNRVEAVVTAVRQGLIAAPRPSRPLKELHSLHQNFLLELVAGTNDARARQERTGVRDEVLKAVGAASLPEAAAMFASAPRCVEDPRAFHQAVFLRLPSSQQSLFMETALGKRPVEIAKARGIPEKWDSFAQTISKGLEALELNNPVQLALRLAACGLIDWPERDATLAARIAALSPVDTYLLGLLGRGYSDGEIAAAVGLSRRAVSERLETLLASLAIANKPQAALLAVVHGLAPRPDLSRPALAQAAPTPPQILPPKNANASWWRLTPRDRMCIAMVCGGLSNPDIASEFKMSLSDVEDWIGELCFTLGCASRASLAAYGARRGVRTAQIALTKPIQDSLQMPAWRFSVLCLTAEGASGREIARSVGPRRRNVVDPLEETRAELGIPPGRGVYGLAQLCALAATPGVHIVPMGEEHAPNVPETGAFPASRLKDPPPQEGRSRSLKSLPKAELDVARQLLKGESQDSIRADRQTSYSAYNGLRSRILRRLQVDNEWQFAIVALGTGFIQGYEPSDFQRREMLRKRGSTDRWLLWALGSGLHLGQMASALQTTERNVLGALNRLRTRFKVKGNTALARLALALRIARLPS
ncbi:MAG: hypothetical protein ACKVPX_11775 [Myxococcaceae bacterium]